MTQWLYTVKIDNERVANDMDLHNALILVEALFNKYFNDNSINITIERYSNEVSYVMED